MIGQPDFVTVEQVVVTQTSLRAPQGVWIQNGKLFVADTQNDRVMIWNTLPTKNNQPADLVLGAPNFTTTPNLDLINSSLVAAANTMLNPTSVTSDGSAPVCLRSGVQSRVDLERNSHQDAAARRRRGGAD